MEQRFKNRYGNIELTIDSDIVNRLINEYGTYLDYGYSELEFKKDEITGNEALVLIFKNSGKIESKDIFKKYAPDFSTIIPKNYDKVVIIKKEKVTYHLFNFHLACVDTYKDNIRVEFESGRIYAVRDI